VAYIIDDPEKRRREAEGGQDPASVAAAAPRPRGSGSAPATPGAPPAVAAPVAGAPPGQAPAKARLLDLRRLATANSGAAQQVAQRAVNVANDTTTRAADTLARARADYQTQALRAVAPPGADNETLAGLSYTGPRSLTEVSSFGDAATAAAKARDVEGALARGSVLTGTRRGAGAFDALTARPAASPGLGEARGRLAGLREQFAKAVGDTSATRGAEAILANQQAAAQGALAAREQTRGAVGTATTEWQNALDRDRQLTADYERMRSQPGMLSFDVPYADWKEMPDDLRASLLAAGSGFVHPLSPARAQLNNWYAERRRR
jgi:hypothetical protein